MPGVEDRGRLDTLGAVIPVGAVQALVANANDMLVTVRQCSSIEVNRQTFSQPSQMAAWTLRPPGRQ